MPGLTRGLAGNNRAKAVSKMDRPKRHLHQGGGWMGWFSRKGIRPATPLCSLCTGTDLFLPGAVCLGLGGAPTSISRMMTHPETPWNTLKHPETPHTRVRPSVRVPPTQCATNDVFSRVVVDSLPPPPCPRPTPMPSNKTVSLREMHYASAINCLIYSRDIRKVSFLPMV